MPYNDQTTLPNKLMSESDLPWWVILRSPKHFILMLWAHAIFTQITSLDIALRSHHPWMATIFSKRGYCQNRPSRETWPYLIEIAFFSKSGNTPNTTSSPWTNLVHSSFQVCSSVSVWAEPSRPCTTQWPRAGWTPCRTRRWVGWSSKEPSTSSAPCSTPAVSPNATFPANVIFGSVAASFSLRLGVRLEVGRLCENHSILKSPSSFNYVLSSWRKMGYIFFWGQHRMPLIGWFAWPFRQLFIRHLLDAFPIGFVDSSIFFTADYISQASVASYETIKYQRTSYKALKPVLVLSFLCRSKQ